MLSKRKHFIICGAGASHDFIAHDEIPISKQHEWLRLRPPLANELLSSARFAELMEKHYDVSDLTASVQSALRSGKDIETYLLELKEIGGHRSRQLVAFQFYLRDLFMMISAAFKRQPGNNYSELINKIRDTRSGACILTFNYDTLLDTNLSYLNDEHELNDYIRHEIQLIKVHGSCNWSYVFGPIGTRAQSFIEQAGGLEPYLIGSPDSIFGFAQKSRPELRPEPHFSLQDGTSSYESYPALAIPMHTKHEHICPIEHMQEIPKALSQTAKVLVIGWKAGDEHITSLLAENIKFPTEFTIVSKDISSAEAIGARIKQKITVAQIKPVGGGFGKFLSSPASQEFFS